MRGRAGYGGNEIVGLCSDFEIAQEHSSGPETTGICEGFLK